MKHMHAFMCLHSHAHMDANTCKAHLACEHSQLFELELLGHKLFNCIRQHTMRTLGASKADFLCLYVTNFLCVLTNCNGSSSSSMPMICAGA